MTEQIQNIMRPGCLAGFLASASLIALFPAGAMAQGSSLFAVGEGASGSAAQKTSPPRPAASGSKPAASSPKPAAWGSKSTAYGTKPTASGSKPAASGSKPAASGSRSISSTAQRKSRGRSVAGKQAGAVALNGRWQDSECIPLTGLTYRPALYVMRQYDFNDARRAWRLDAAVYTSDRCIVDSRLLTYEGHGTFTVTGRSRVASNAYDASFKIDRWAATPVSRQGVLTLLNGRCGSGHFAEGQTLDLSTSGCPTLGIRSIGQSPTEIELVSVSNGKFFLGSRAFIPGLSDARPAQLSSYGLTRVR